MAGLSVIIPFVNEYPQVLFTIRNIAEELKHEMDFEIIAVDNWCQEVEDQGFHRQKDGEMIKNMANHNDWLKYIHYDKKLSCWQSRRVGAEFSTYDTLFFIDSHCLISKNALRRAVHYYIFHPEIDGTLHFPLTYHILEEKRLIYSLVWKPEYNELHYKFTSLKGDRKGEKQPFQVPVMSSCGMIMSREIYNLMGGLPKQLGIYGGGENYINFTLAVLGKKKWIFPEGVIFHHGSKRQYNWNYNDYQRNRLIANYCFGGEKWAAKWWDNVKGNPVTLNAIWEDVLSKCKDRREKIKQHQKIDILDWIDKNNRG